MNSEQVNMAVAKLLGWTDIEEKTYWLEDYYDISEVTGLEGVPKGSNTRRLIPDYCHDLNAAMATAGQKLKGISIQQSDDLVGISWEDQGGEWHVMNPFSDPDFSRTAAKVCEAILQAHGVTVASEQEGGK